MTYKVRNRGITVLAVLTILLVCIAVLNCLGFLSAKEQASADGLFNLSDEVVLEKNRKVSDAFLNGKTGYRFSTTQSDASFTIKEKLAGNFRTEFSPVASKNGETDFEKLIFTFSSESSNLSFDVVFSAYSSKVVMGISLSNNSVYCKEKLVEGSFDNTSANPVSFSFDPQAMIVYDCDGNAAIDLKDPDMLIEYYSSAVFGSFETYSVSIAFSGVKDGHKASVIFFSYCGQELSGEELVNTSAPVIVKAPTLSDGVKGKNYTINKNVQTFDAIDGFSSEFNGITEVYDQFNQAVNVKDGYFVPDKAGKYYISYIPVDSHGLSGASYTYPIYVYEAQPTVEFEFEFPITDENLGIGESFLFPKVVGYSLLNSETLPVSIEIVKDGERRFGSYCDKNNSYIFNESGVYEVKFVARDYVEYTVENTYSFTVSDTAVFDFANWKTSYLYGEVVDLSGITCSYRGKSYAVDVFTEIPGGESTNSKFIHLDKTGTYKLTVVSETENGAVSRNRYFSVSMDNQSLWEKADGLTVASDYNAPSYADEKYNGTLLTATRPVEAKYANVIDLSDNTKNDILCEFFVAPSSAGSVETTKIEFVFQDAYNPDNVLTIAFCEDPWGYYPWAMSALAYDKESVITPDNTRAAYYSGMVYSSFYGKIATATAVYPSQSVKIYFDYSEKKIYADTVRSDKDSSAYAKGLLIDLNNTNYRNITGLTWEKFTTGEVNFSVRISKINQAANVMILNVDGQSMSGKHNTTTVNPSIFIDLGINGIDNVPFGIVDKRYNIFDAYCVDAVNGRYACTDVSVYFADGMEKIQCGEFFIPKQAGDYVIEYRATGADGGAVTKRLTVTVKQADEIPPIIYSFSEDIVDSAYVGEVVRVFNGEIGGGTGALSYTTEIVKDGRAVALDKNGCFYAAEAGVYKIIVTVSDYVSSKTFEKTVTVEYSGKPILAAKTLPKAIVAGEEFEIPVFTAQMFDSNGARDVEVKSYVNGEEASSYTPSEEGEITLTYKAEDIELASYTIKVTSAASNNGYSGQFFYSEAEAVNPISTSVMFDFAATNTVDFARKISDEFLNFSVEIGKTENKVFGYNNFSILKFTLTDSENPDIAVSGYFKPLDNTKSYFVFEGVSYTVSGSFSNNARAITFAYNKAQRAFSSDSSDLCRINYCDNGKIFEGFTSGQVYLSFTADEVSGPSAFGVISVADQSFKKGVTQDKQAPKVKIDGSFDSVEIGDELVIPSAIAFDVISGVRSFTVSVSDPERVAVLSNAATDKEYRIPVSAYGTYNVVYTATDNLGNKKAYTYIVQVSDRTPPEIIISGNVPEQGKVNKTISLPSATAKDDNSETVYFYCYYTAPDGYTERIINNSFVPSQKGIYVVTYFAYDEDGASSVKVFMINVS